MACPECGGETVAFPVDESLRSHLPGDAPGAEICSVCLELRPVSDPPDEPDSFERLGDAFPSRPAAAVPTALVVGLLSSLATHRDEIATLLELVEREGVDPLLTLDRLADDPDVESSVDLAGRRRQLEQLL